MDKKIGIAIGGAVLLAAVAFGIWQYQSTHTALPVSLAAIGMHQRVPFQIEVSTDRTTASSGVARYRIVVRQDGKLQDLLAAKKYPHAAIVSADLSDIAFYHADRLDNPSQGVFEFTHNFTADTAYTLWVEVNDNNLSDYDHHGENSDVVVRVDLSGPKAETLTTQRLTGTDRDYILTLVPDTLKIGAPSQFRILTTTTDGATVPLVTDIDHFYFAASPDGQFYTLDHPDLAVTKDNSITVKNLTFPKAGQYAVWVRVFAADAENTPIDLIEGSFVVSVP